MWCLLDSNFVILGLPRKNKEDYHMKATVMQKRAPAYPNAATRRQVAHKVLDLLLMAAIGAGAAAIALFVLALA